MDSRKEDFTQVGFDTSTACWLYQIMFPSLFLLMLFVIFDFFKLPLSNFDEDAHMFNLHVVKFINNS